MIVAKSKSQILTLNVLLIMFIHLSSLINSFVEKFLYKINVVHWIFKTKVCQEFFSFYNTLEQSFIAMLHKTNKLVLNINLKFEPGFNLGLVSKSMHFLKPQQITLQFFETKYFDERLLKN